MVRLHSDDSRSKRMSVYDDLSGIAFGFGDFADGMALANVPPM